MQQKWLSLNSYKRMKKISVSPSKNIVRKVHIIDAANVPLGRLATKISILLMGKHKRTIKNNIDCGDIVEITNAAQVKMTGRKFEQALFYRHSRYPGSLKTQTAAEVLKKDPRKLIGGAVYNMLPNNNQRKDRMNRLRFNS